MKVIRDPGEFQKVTVVLETERDLMSLYRITCDGLYDAFKKKYGDNQGIMDEIFGFKGMLHKRLEENIPVSKQVL